MAAPEAAIHLARVRAPLKYPFVTRAQRKLDGRVKLGHDG